MLTERLKRTWKRSWRKSKERRWGRRRKKRLVNTWLIMPERAFYFGGRSWWIHIGFTFANVANFVSPYTGNVYLHVKTTGDLRGKSRDKYLLGDTDRPWSQRLTSTSTGSKILAAFQGIEIPHCVPISSKCVISTTLKHSNSGSLTIKAIICNYYHS